VIWAEGRLNFPVLVCDCSGGPVADGGRRYSVPALAGGTRGASGGSYTRSFGILSGWFTLVGVARERKADMVPHLTYAEAVVVGLFQGVTELFPVSSLGHSVLIPALVGGSWARDLSISRPHSPYLAFIVGLHVATAIAMIIYFWRDWLRIISGFFTSIAHRRIETVDQKLAWMIILATIPIGIVGALLQHAVQSTFAKPVVTAIFLTVNGLVLFGGERLRRREVAAYRPAAPRPVAEETWVAGPDRNRAMAPGARPGTREGAAMRSGSPGERGWPYDEAPGPYDRAPGPYDRPEPYDRTEPYDRLGYYQAEPYDRAPGRYADERDAAPWGPAGPRAQAAGPRAQAAGRHSAGQRAVRQQEATEAIEADARLAEVGYRRGTVLGALQIFALLPGISRDGVVMVGGMFRGLSRQDAARFSFLLSAPVIFAAGALKLSELTGPDASGIRGQVLVGSIVSGVGAFLALRFLVRYLQDHSRTLMPFAIYCLVAGIGSAVYLSLT
jgi:undecaprenyl-diphosphatase